jgi:DNA primase
LIKRHAERVYTLFDSDNAGKKATLRSMELFIEQGIPAYVISLPKGDDPDSYLSKHSTEAFLEQRDKARPIFDFFIRTLLQETPPNNVTNKVKVINEIAPFFKKISSSSERSLYEKEACRLLDIAVYEFRKQLGKLPTEKRNEVPSATENKAVKDRSQEMLLAILVNFPEARETIQEEGVDTLFEGDYLDLAETIIAETSGIEFPDWSALLGRLEKQELSDLLARLLFTASQLAGMDWRVAFEECKQVRVKKRISFKDISLRLAVIDPDTEEYATLLKQADTLRTRKSKL